MAEALRNGERIAVPAFNGHYTRRPQARMRHQPFPLAVADKFAQTNILIDRDFHPRLTDYGLVAIITDPNIVDPVSTVSPSDDTFRYMAPELLNPAGFGLEDSISTKKSDIYAFGIVTYQVRKPCFISDIVIEGNAQITTGQQPFPEVKDGMVIYNVIAGERPDLPLDPNEWVSGNVWDLISRCWSSSLNSRPDAKSVTNTLITAADAVEVRRGTRPERWEVDLDEFLRLSETWDQGNDRERAQRFADRLNEVRRPEILRYQVP